MTCRTLEVKADSVAPCGAVSLWGRDAVLIYVCAGDVGMGWRTRECQQARSAVGMHFLSF